MHFSITMQLRNWAGPMQSPGLFDLADARGKYGLVHIGLGGAVIVSSSVAQTFTTPTAQTDATDWDIITLMNCERLPVQMWTRSDPSRTRRAIATCKVV
ncbi:hypothetical protein EDB84DRAFT_1554128, partial [Lactarius hengduanensis]